MGELDEALDAVISGRGVARATHALVVDGRDAADAFEKRLAALGWRSATVKDARVAEDRRVPAWVVGKGFAVFGWVFFEHFDEKRKRKLFGSAERTKSGDWRHLRQGDEAVWVLESAPEDYDPAHFYGE